MNAPVEAPALAAELVPFDVICPSDTHIQILRRQRFDTEKLLELAANIQKLGVLEPVLLRPFPASRGSVRDRKGATPKYELVAGERRWIAAQRAGLAHIPAVIRQLDDGDVLLAQMSENTQRDDYTPLEEAAGYADLKAIKDWDAQEIADHIGKSKSYVYARLKLSDLIDECRAALNAGDIDFSKALLLARFGPKLQKKALKLVRDVPYDYAFRLLRYDFMAELGDAPFRLDDERRSIQVGETCYAFDCGPCTTCPHSSANDPELAREIKHDAHVCTNKPCFDLKTTAHWAELRHQAKAAGAQILVAAAIPHEYDGYNADYVRLDCELYPDGEDEGVRTAAQLMPDVTPVLAEGKDGQLIKLVPMKIAKPLLKKHGIELDVQAVGPALDAGDTDEDRAQRSAEAKREQERRAVETEYRKRLFAAIAAKPFKGGLKRPDLERIAAVLDETGYSDALDELFPEKPNFAKLKEDELVRYIVLNTIADNLEVHDKPGGLLELAQRFKIDAKALRAQVVKDLKPVSAPPADDETETKPAPKKRGAKK